MINTYKLAKVILPVMAGVFMICTACGNRHFMTDETYRSQVHGDFEKRKELAAGRDSALFSVFDRELTAEQTEALEFLYAYMPLSDLADYDGEFFLRQVDGAFRARDHFKWNVPEEIFRHFVLVYRVNNENLDEARDVFFEELKDRIAGMSMRDAALEINHWCHEKVTYRGSDARTSAPLATVRTSWGRCGEQSTFTVAALRAVGIPARQCYTPRWVHTDSNHAWVEVWIDGKWHYMGACEPEPELDVAWFDGPVQRAMMTHTTVYGRYNGPEEKNIETPLYSVINTLSVYAPVRRAAVQVVDATGIPVEGATVRFEVYNSAEMYSIVTLQSDAEGHVAIDTGKGDLLVWASKDDKYGYAKSAPEDTLTVVSLSRTPGEVYTETFTMAAPEEQPFSELPEEMIAANAVRLAHEDSIRNAYMATFPDKNYAAKVAEELGLPVEQVWKWLNYAQGNWREVEAFIRNANTSQLANFMSSLTQKDLRDTPAAVLADYMPSYVYQPIWRSAVVPDENLKLDVRNVVSPRIGRELLTSWRSYFQNVMNNKDTYHTVDDLVKMVADGIRVSDTDNYFNCPITPRGVHELRVADGYSRDIYFVALCRALDIPARLDPLTEKPQYLDNGTWRSVSFELLAGMRANKVELTLKGNPSNIVNPIYGSHFSVARFEDGDFRTLEMYGQSLPVRIPVDEGYYRIITASRANDGSAKITAQYLNIGADGASAEIKLPELEGKLFVKGVVDMNSIVVTSEGEKTTLKKLGRGQGAVLIFADPDKEPTKHILQELPTHSAAFEQWGGAVVFMVPDDKTSAAFDASLFPGQPSQTVWAADPGRTLLNATASALQLQFRNNFPLVVYLTNNGGILFASEGYRIGIPEEILRMIKLEAETKS